MRGATAPRLLLELICARVLLPAVGDDEASLLVRLERLERRFAIAGDSAAADVPAVSRAVPAAPTSARTAPAVAESAPPAPVGAPPEPIAQPTVAPAPADRGPSDVLAAPAAVPPPVAAADLDAAAVRRLWDDVLEVAKRLKRRTHALLLSGPAQVVEVRGSVLILGFATDGVARQFNTGDNFDILRVALKEVLGVDWRIETTLSGPAAAAAGDDEQAPVKPAPPLPTPSESMAADRAPSRSSAARAAANEPKEPRVRRAAAPEAPVAIVLDEPNVDDDDADDGTSGLALLQRHLGATVINDGETP
jgi:DNA polymerase III subunit gamma/tau